MAVLFAPALLIAVKVCVSYLCEVLEWVPEARALAQVVLGGDGNVSIYWRSMFASWLVAGD
jgi:hypothetical protein